MTGRCRAPIRRGAVRWTLVALGALPFLAGCASIAPAPWPPTPGEARHTILVSLDTWHAMIAFPLPEGGGSGRTRRFEEWGFAEQAWYLEGRQGVSGALRALLKPSAAVVEVTVSDRIWAERTPQPPAETFVFEIDTPGSERLRAYLRASIADPEPIAVLGGSAFYRARRSYHLFHQCHQYAAQALRAAGLSTSPAWAVTRGLFALQLREVGRASGSPDPAYPPGGVRKIGH